MKFTPEAANFTTASFAFGSGTGNSTGSIASGPPGCFTCMAFMALWILGIPRKFCDRKLYASHGMLRALSLSLRAQRGIRCLAAAIPAAHDSRFLNGIAVLE